MGAGWLIFTGLLLLAIIHHSGLGDLISIHPIIVSFLVKTRPAKDKTAMQCPPIHLLLVQRNLG